MTTSRTPHDRPNPSTQGKTVMAKDALTTFDFNSNLIRVVEIDGEPWFLAIDLAKVLELNSPWNAYRRLDDAEKTNLPRTEVGFGAGKPLVLISESGLYKLVMRSDKPVAKPFQFWVTHDVLPAIRKDGGYIAGEEKVATGEMSEDELVFKAMEVMKAKITRLQNENIELKPRAAVADRLSEHQRTLSKVAGMFEGINRNKVSTVLREHGYLRKDRTGVHRVRGRYRDTLFAERIDPHYGTATIIVLPKGYEKLEALYAAGELPMKKGFRPAA